VKPPWPRAPTTDFRVVSPDRSTTPWMSTAHGRSARRVLSWVHFGFGDEPTAASGRRALHQVGRCICGSPLGGHDGQMEVG